MAVQFYVCKHCGNIVEMVKNVGVPVVCCGEAMTALTPNTTDAAQEKHVPVCKVDGDTVHVDIGSVTHPMTEEHDIQWIVLETDHGVYRKMLKPGDAPSAKFSLEGEKAIAAYAYCNLHGLWKASI